MQRLAFDLHPDMLGLVNAKETAAKVAASGDIRGAWDAYGASMQRPYPADMSVTDVLLPVGPVRPGGLPARIYRPANARPGAACVLYLHGGAFVKGSLDSGDAIAWGISDEIGAVVVSIDYRLAPEHPFPAALEDCYAALRHLASHQDELGINRERIGLWGDSAGGNLAAATCLATRDRKGPPVAALTIHYPCLTDELTSPSYSVYAESPGLQTGWMDHCWGLYLSGDRPTRNPYAAPLKAQSFSDFPPTHVHIAEIDCLADDGRAFAQKLRTANRQVEFACAERMIHGFLRARFFGPGALAEFQKPCSFFRRRLKCD
jgi:acetyl esterase